MESREGDHVRLGSLDTLRGVAILLVILFHVAGHFPSFAPRSGVVAAVENQGVQLFFLVSAFTMSVMWAARSGEDRPALKFYIRRICRIAPLYWLAIIGYFGLFGRSASGFALAANALLAHGLFPSAINNVVPGGWSIGVEMAFYAIFPLVALLPSRWLLAAGLAWYLACGIGVEAVLLGGHADPLGVYYTAFTQLPVFLCGMYVFHLLRSPAAAAPLASAGVAATWLAAALLLRDVGLPGRPLFWAGIALMAAAMWAVLRFELSAKPLQLLGRLSYSMYLLHYAVIVLLADLAPRLWYPVAVVAVTAATGALSFLSFRTFETGSQQLGRHLVARLGRR